MKNIRIYKAPKYRRKEYTKAEENIWLHTVKADDGVLVGITDPELADQIRSRSGWEVAPEPWDFMFYMLEVDGVRYYKEIEGDEDETISVEEQDTVSYVTSLMFEQEPEYGENAPEDPDVSQYPLEDLLDRFSCSISDSYEKKNKADAVNSYLEFESEDLENIKQLLTIVGKHVYNRSDDEGTALVIKQEKCLMDEMDLGEPVSSAEIAEAEKQMDIRFPEDYKEFMLLHNGAEGEIGDQEYLVLWTIQEVPELNREYGVNEFTPGLVYFGSDGGDLMYAFDMRDEKKTIVRFPSDCIHIEKAEAISDTFEGFIDFLCHSENAE